MKLRIYNFSNLISFFPSFFSSQSNGNCLYSSISIHLVGNSSLALKLRVISCLELFLNAEFYFNHPNFKYSRAVIREKFKHFNNALSFAFKTQPPDNLQYSKELVLSEALHMCQNFDYASYTCILALSSVIGSQIRVHRPKMGVGLIEDSYLVYSILLFFLVLSMKK